jgi:hypothetical protein
MGIAGTLRRLEMGKRWGKRERFRCFTCSTPLVGVLPSKLPAIAGGMGKQPDGCNHEPPGSASRALLVRAESQGWSEVTERKRKRDGRKSREVSLAAEGD